MEMPELGFVFWNRLGQDREERGKQIDALNPNANVLGKFVCGTICVLAIHRRFPFAKRITDLNLQNGSLIKTGCSLPRNHSTQSSLF
jgi:hypothetical protein